VIWHKDLNLFLKLFVIWHYDLISDSPITDIYTSLQTERVASGPNKLHCLVYKVKCAILHEECRRNAHLSFLGLESAGG